jgi:ketosteroid isomerase-like protein
LALALTTLAQAAAPMKNSAAEVALLKAEDLLFEADAKRDVEAIRRGFADEALFMHANGMSQTKSDYIRATESSTNSVKSITTEDRVVRVFGNVGMTRAVKKLEVGDMHLSGTYLTIYIKRDGRWQMLSSQSTPAPRATPANNSK